jgi:hypothetical protein
MPTTAQSFDLGELSYIFDTPAEPVDVAVTLDTAGTVEALIPVEGGSISATGADGTVYTLEIPADALLSETTISLTPVTSIAGMPFGGEQTYAVQLGPDGLFLYNFAILTITPVVELPIEEQIVFGYLEDGKDLILAAPVVDSNEIQIQVLHFSGNGVTKGLLADIEPVRERLGGDAERIMENAVSIELALTRQGAVVGEARRELFAEAFREYEEQVVKPRVAAAGESCAAGQLAEQTVLRLDFMRKAFGLSQVSENYYPGLLDTVAQVCVAEEFDLCVEQHIIHRMIQVLVSFKHRYAMLFLPADNVVIRLAEGLTEKCLTFKLVFESRASAEDLYVSTMKSEITLRFNPDDFTISGGAKLENVHFEFFDPYCDVTSIPGGGTFTVHNLEILDQPGEVVVDLNLIPQQLGQVGDFVLSYQPGVTSEYATLVCDGDVVSPVFPGAWSINFLTTHIDEIDMSSGLYISTDWEILGNEHFAKKPWTEEDGYLAEYGKFDLYHTPGK